MVPVAAGANGQPPIPPLLLSSAAVPQCRSAAVPQCRSAARYRGQGVGVPGVAGAVEMKPQR
jgi:hypothetical protein